MTDPLLNRFAKNPALVSPDGGGGMTDSEYLKWKRRLGLRTSAAQDSRCLTAESLGLRFQVDFGTETSMERIRIEAILKDIEKLKAKRKVQ